MEGKYIFTQESFYVQGIVNDINEYDTLFLGCKHKHIIKSRAPPEKVGSPGLSVTYSIPWFHKQN